MMSKEKKQKKNIKEDQMNKREDSKNCLSCNWNNKNIKRLSFAIRAHYPQKNCSIQMGPCSTKSAKASSA